MTTPARERISPVVCAPWCEDGDGHPDAVFRDDQTCWGEAEYLNLDLESAAVDEYGEHVPRLGVMLKRQHERAPTVCYIHVELPHWNIDTCISLIAPESRRVAAVMIAAADVIEVGEGTESG